MKLLNLLAFSVGGGLLAVVVVLMLQAAASRHGQAPGLVDGHLAACSPKPNCVASEAGTPPDKRVAPFALTDGRYDQQWQAFQDRLTAAGGQLVQVTPDYLAATFTSALFGFVDDFEARLDSPAGVIQVRSASRVGTSDLGANRTRVEALRRAWGRDEP